MQNREILVVLTSEEMRDFIRVGGTSTWKLDPKRANRCKYVVCAYNPLALVEEVNHRKGFFIGKISYVKPSTKGLDSWKDKFESASVKRYTVHVSEYADIDVPELWGKWQNPVKYINESEILSMLGIKSFNDLTFKPLPKSSNHLTSVNVDTQENTLKDRGFQKSLMLDKGQGLTIDQAKAGIAVRMGISPQNIEIRITA